jgi:hypothetical protein
VRAAELRCFAAKNPQTVENDREMISRFLNLRALALLVPCKSSRRDCTG